VSLSAPVERVVALLEREGYETIEQPRPVGGIPFEFAAMLAGVGSLDLVAVIDVDDEGDATRIRARVEGLARALDLVRSRRSLTLILVGVRPASELIQALTRVGRVLLTSAPPGEEGEPELRDALAVLLPLEIETDVDSVADSWSSTRNALEKAHPTEAAGALAAAEKGSKAVEQAVAELLAEPVDALFADDDEDWD
jgi:hypothetical protein